MRLLSCFYSNLKLSEIDVNRDRKGQVRPKENQLQPAAGCPALLEELGIEKTAASLSPAPIAS